jgi:hypothetical protein
LIVLGNKSNLGQPNAIIYGLNWFSSHYVYRKALGRGGLPKIRGLKQGDSQIQPNIFGNILTHGLHLS